MYILACNLALFGIAYAARALARSTSLFMIVCNRDRQRPGLNFGKFRDPGRSRAEMPGSGIPAIPDFFTSFKSKGTPEGRMPQTFQKIGPTEGTGFYDKLF